MLLPSTDTANWTLKKLKLSVKQSNFNNGCKWCFFSPSTLCASIISTVQHTYAWLIESIAFHHPAPHTQPVFPQQGRLLKTILISRCTCSTTCPQPQDNCYIFHWICEICIRKERRKKAHDLKTKDPEEVGRLVKSSQASAHYASAVKAAKRLLRIQTDSSNYRDGVQGNSFW